MVDYLEVARSIFADSKSNNDAGWAVAAALIAIAERMPSKDLTINFGGDPTYSQLQDAARRLGVRLKTDVVEDEHDDDQ